MTLLSVIERAIQTIRPGSMIQRTRSISNSDPHKMTAVDIQRASGQTETLVVRRQSLDAITQEARLLRLLAETTVPIPEVYDAQQTMMIQSYIAGKSVFSPADVTACVTGMAQMLAQIHQTLFSHNALNFLPAVNDVCQVRLANRPDTLQARMGEPQIRAVLERDWQTLTHNPPTLLHGDFWPGNLLWRAETIIGVIDWEDAMTGDPLADLGNTRREILWFFGKEAMQQFTAAYREAMPHLNYETLPYWDLCMALTPIGNVSSWCLDETRKQRFRERQRWLVNQACDALNSRQ